MMLQKQILHTANYLHKKLQVFMAIFCTKIFFFFKNVQVNVCGITCSIILH